MKAISNSARHRAALVVDTLLVNGVYVQERRRRNERRKKRGAFRGYDRRVSAERRDVCAIDEYV